MGYEKWWFFKWYVKYWKSDQIVLNYFPVVGNILFYFNLAFLVSLNQSVEHSENFSYKLSSKVFPRKMDTKCPGSCWTCKCKYWGRGSLVDLWQLWHRTSRFPFFRVWILRAAWGYGESALAGWDTTRTQDHSWSSHLKMSIFIDKTVTLSY